MTHDNLLFTLSTDNVVKVWDVRMRQCMQSISTLENRVGSLQKLHYNARNGSLVAVGNRLMMLNRLPQVFEDGRVLYCEDIPFGIDLPNVLFTPLTVASGPRQAGATSLDGMPKRRAIALTDKATVAALNLTKMQGLAVYKPITKRHE